MKIVPGLLAGLLTLWSAASAQNLLRADLHQDSVAHRSDVAIFSVHTDIEGARVFVDGTLVGNSPVTGASITFGRHEVRYCSADSSRWPVSVVVESLTISSSPIERSIRFPSLYHFISEPYGASIRVNDSIIGTTPMYYTGALTGQVISFAKVGYEDANVVVPAEGGDVFAPLRPSNTGGINSSPLMVSDQSKSLTPIIVASGVAVLSGSVAAYFKIKADRSYDEYLITGSPGALNRVDSYDRYSAIALVTSQLSLLALSYLLLSQ